MSQGGLQPEQEETLQLQDPVQVKEELKGQAENLESENKLLGTWMKSSEDLIQQHKNKFDAFKALADESGYINQNNFNIGGEVKSEIFKKIDADGDGKISETEWTQGWAKLDTKYQENQHKLAIVHQKIDIFEALDAKPELGKHLDDSTLKSNYSSLLDRFKNTRSLDDLSNLFNSNQLQKASPFKNKEPIEVLTQVNFEVKKNRKVDSILEQFKTPNKSQDYIQDNSSGRNSYIPNQVPVSSFVTGRPTSKRQSSGKSPIQRFNSTLASPSVGFIAASQYQSRAQQQQENQINSKVQQNMNISFDTKDLNKTSKRKEDLQNYMGKLGLGKYEVPKVSITLDSKNGIVCQYVAVLDRLRNYVNGTAPIPVSQKQPQGLSDFDGYSGNSFKQTLKNRKQLQEQSQREPRQVSTGKDAAGLQEQSLKNFTLKQIHLSKLGSAEKKYGRN